MIRTGNVILAAALVAVGVGCPAEGVDGTLGSGSATAATAPSTLSAGPVPMPEPPPGSSDTDDSDTDGGGEGTEDSTDISGGGSDSGTAGGGTTGTTDELEEYGDCAILKHGDLECPVRATFMEEDGTLFCACMEYCPDDDCPEEYECGLLQGWENDTCLRYCDEDNPCPDGDVCVVKGYCVTEL